MPLFEPIFEALNGAGVRYVVVGGVAVVLHGHVRLTVDLDLVIDLDPTNARLAMRSLQEAGFRPRVPESPEAFADPDQRRRWIDERNMRVFSLIDPEDPMREIDVFVEEPIPFADLWAESVVMDLGSTTVRIASRRHLIQLKREAGRPQDLIDVEALEELDRDG